MTIRHLEIFICVAECGKMSHAAKKLYIAQPTVSQAIKEIEKQSKYMKDEILAYAYKQF